MKYIENQREMFMKYRAIFDMLKGSVDLIEKVIITALSHYDKTDGGNERELLEGFYLMIEAIEKVAMIEQKISPLKADNDLLKYISNMKEAFKKVDLVNSALEEMKNATFH